MNNFSAEKPMVSESVESETIQIESDFENELGERGVIEVDKNAPGLFLFDIDGTLIDAKQIHGPAAIRLFKKTFGVRPELPFSNPEFVEKFIKAYISHWGLGDRREFELLAKDFGVSFGSERDKEKVLDEMTAHYSEEIETRVREASTEEKVKMILPGVILFLEEMKQRGIPAALVTGNVSKSAKAFMKYLGLGKYFITGGFDDDSEVTDQPYRRASILASAIKKCRAKGLEFLPEQMVVFGDTAKDFEATLHQGETRPFTFLVATGDKGLHSLAEVTDRTGTKRPHMVLPSLANIKIKPFFDSLDRYK